MTCIIVTITNTRGSAPRETGAQMKIWGTSQEGSIGGGALEWEAMRIARQMLADGQSTRRQSFALGPNLGQCCGGNVTLEFSTEATLIRPDPKLWIWGAGHVGRAIVQTVGPLDQFAITWVDSAPERFPETDLRTLPVPNIPDAARLAPPDAHHIIVTYSHAFDLEICHRLLGLGFKSAGLIGSGTKWTRFRKRLGELGHSDAQISRIRCPIGQPELGKHPQAIALGVASELLLLAQSGDVGQGLAV